MFLFCVLEIDAISAADFYVDASRGNDNSSGLSADSAWQTIAKVNSSLTLESGDRVLLKRGERWTEKLVIPQSGITISAYGNGPRPLLDGLTEVGLPNYQWALAQSLSSGVKQVWYLKGGAGSFSYSIAVLKQGDQLMRLAYRGNNYLAGKMLRNHEYARINSTQDYGSWTFYVRIDEGQPSGKETLILLAKDHDTLLDTNNQSDLLIEGLAIRGAIKSRAHSNPAVLLRNAERVTIRNSSVSFSKIAISTSSSREGPFFARNCIIEDNEIHDNVESGIYFRGPASNNKIRSNHIFNNYNKGLSDFIGDNLAIGFTGQKPASDRSGNIVEGNYIYKNGSYDWGSFNDDNAISIYTTSDTTIRFNNIWDNKQGVFYASIGSNNNSFIYNDVVGNEVRSWKSSPKNRPGKTHDGRLIFVLNSDNTKINNNTIVGNSLFTKYESAYYYGMARLIGIEGNSKVTDFRNNIIASNKLVSTADKPAVLLLAWAKGSKIDQNLYFDNISIDKNGKQVDLFYSPKKGVHIDLASWQRAGYEQHSLEGDPLFVGVGIEGLDLKKGSKAINRGANLSFERDIRNNVVGKKPDIGAHEYIGPNSGL